VLYWCIGPEFCFLDLVKKLKRRMSTVITKTVRTSILVAADIFHETAQSYDSEGMSGLHLNEGHVQAWCNWKIVTSLLLPTTTQQTTYIYYLAFPNKWQTCRIDATQCRAFFTSDNSSLPKIYRPTHSLAGFTSTWHFPWHWMHLFSVASGHFNCDNYNSIYTQFYRF